MRFKRWRKYRHASTTIFESFRYHRVLNSEVRRGRIGVTSTDLVPELARELGVKSPEGAVVVAVETDSPARNGLRAGDIVYGVNRRRVRSVGELVRALRGADSTLRVALLRGEYRITLVIR